MRRTVNFPRLRRVKISEYDLYPGPSSGGGLDWKFPEGVSIAVGINGLGKTTFVNAILWGILGGKRLPKADQFGIGSGRFDLTKAKVDKFFAERVPDRAADATIELWFDLGQTSVYLQRRLANLALQQLKVGSTSVREPDEDDYMARMAEHAGLSDAYQFHVVVRCLLFFLEERVTLLWDRAAQFEMLRILLIDEDLAEKLKQLNAQIHAEDSDLRNVRWVLNKLTARYGIDEEQDDDGVMQGLTEIEDKLKLLETQRQASSDRLSDLSQERGRTFESLQALQAKKLRLEVTIGEDEAKLNHMHHVWLRHITPSTEDSARLLLGGLLAGGGCAICGSRDREIRARVEADLANQQCPVCHSDASQQEVPVSRSTTVGIAQINELATRTQTHRLQVQSLEKEIEELTRSYDASRTGVFELTKQQTDLDTQLEQVRGQLPQSDDERDAIRRQILENKMMIERNRKALIDKRKRYISLLDQANTELASKTSTLEAKFKEFAQEFLREKVELEYQQIMTPLGQELSKVPVPSFSVRMTSGVEKEVPSVRLSDENVSESQREFLELAFRMALMVMATKGRYRGLLVMETPEASLDEVFAERAGDMLRKFAGMGGRSANAGAQVFATCNLNGAPVINHLLGPRPPRRRMHERKPRVLNLLKISAPNAAYLQYKDVYDKAFTEATGL